MQKKKYKGETGKTQVNKEKKNIENVNKTLQDHAPKKYKKCGKIEV